MPFRAFTCRNCETIADGMYGLHDDTPKCCYSPMVRDYHREGMGQRPTGAFDKPIVMYSVGLNPEEIPAFKKACPDIDVATSGPLMGIPIARTRHQKKQILRTMGFEERN